jgi:hypothetical protein
MISDFEGQYGRWQKPGILIMLEWFANVYVKIVRFVDNIHEHLHASRNPYPEILSDIQHTYNISVEFTLFFVQINKESLF